MKLALVFLVALAGCVIPQQTAPLQAGPPPAPTASAGAPVTAGASCQDTISCYSQCNPLTDACAAACDARTTPDSAQNAHAVLQCMAQSGCRDNGCVAQQCGAPITACTSTTLAPSATTTAAAPASGGDSCEAVMQPQYNAVNAIWIPPVTCALTQADLAGEWDQGSGTGESYYDASGNYVGSSSISTSSHRSIDAQGNYTEAWKGARTGGGAVQGMSEQTTGTFLLQDNHTVLITSNPNEYHSDTKRAYYIVAGWYADNNGITMSLVGPFSDPPTAQDLHDATSTSYNHENYYRKR